MFGYKRVILGASREIVQNVKKMCYNIEKCIKRRKSVINIKTGVTEGLKLSFSTEMPLSKMGLILEKVVH